MRKIKSEIRIFFSFKFRIIEFTMNHHHNCLLILGMHRSGTSVLSGCLHLLGADLGRNLMPTSEANQSGYFENQDLVLIHDILLRDLGCRWDMVGSLPKDWTQTQAAQDAREKIERVIERDFAYSNLWAVKDPRLCRLLPLWLDLLQDKGIHPRIAFMARHPYEVALSLKNRDGFDMLKGHLLWLSHTREALATCRELDHCILTYDQLLADPLSSLETVSKTLNVDYPESVRHNAHRIIEFVRPDLKRCTLSGNSNPFAPYAWLYDQLRLSQARALEGRFNRAGSGQNPSARFPAQNLDMKGFPLMAWQGQDRAATSHASAVFDNLLSIISSYEQADLNRNILRQRKLLQADQQGETIYAQVYFPQQARNGEHPYAEQSSTKILLAPGEWQQLTLDIPQPELLRKHRLRLDPLNTKGMVRISAVKLLDAVTREAVWSMPGSQDLKACDVNEDGLILDSTEPLLICAVGNDPQILLPQAPDLPDRPLELEVWIKVDRGLRDLAALWQKRDKNLQQKNKKVKELQGQLEQWQEKEKTWQSREQELNQAIQGKDQALQEKDSSIEELQTSKDDLAKRLKNSNAKLEQNLKARENELQQAQDALASKEQELSARKEALEQAKARSQQLEKDLAARDAELDKARQQTAEQGQELDKLQKTNEKLLQEKKELEDALQARDADLEQARAELESSRTQVEDLTYELQSKDKELDQAREELQQAQDALQTKERELSARHEDLEQAKARSEQLEQELQIKDSQVEKLQQDLTHQQELSQQYFQELAKSEEDNSRLQENQQKLQEQVKADEAQIAQVRKDYDQAAQQLAEGQKELDTLRQEKTKLQEQFEAQSKELEQAQNKLNSKLNSLSEARAKVQNFKTALQNRQSSSDDETSPVAEIEQLEQEVQRLKDDLARQENLTREYFTELAKAEEELAKVESEER